MFVLQNVHVRDLVKQHNPIYIVITVFQKYIQKK